MKVKVQFLDGSEETFYDVEVHAGAHYFQLQKVLKDKGPLSLVEEKTDSVYIPYTSIRQLITCNSED